MRADVVMNQWPLKGVYPERVLNTAKYGFDFNARTSWKGGGESAFHQELLSASRVEAVKPRAVEV